MVVFAGTAAASASASKKRSVSFEVGGKPLTRGAPFSAVSSDFTVANSYWRLACTESFLTGQIGATGLQKEDSVRIVEGAFGGGDQGDEALCRSTFEFVVFYEPEEGSEFTFNYKGDVRWLHPFFKLEPLEDVETKGGHTAFSCFVERRKAPANGTFAVSETRRPLVVTFASAGMDLGPNSAKKCGRGNGHVPDLSATFEFMSEGRPIEVELEA